MNADIRKQVEKFAKADLKLAKKNGEIAMTETKLGVVWISFITETGTYKFCGNGGPTHGEFKAADAVAFIVDQLFVITNQG